MGKEIQIVVNGVKEKVPEESAISELIQHFGENPHSLIVELNGRFIYPQSYSYTKVSPDDILEFIQADFGG